MRRHLLTLTTAALLGSASITFAQDVVIVPEQETIIREYVTTQEVEPVELPDVDISVGTTLPDTVELHAIEAPDLDADYQYVVVQDRTVLVEPETRKIIHIIE